MIEGIARVRILDAMAEGLVVFATRFVSVLKIYALSWLVAVAVVVVVDLFWIYIQRRVSPDWVNGICWSVALAPATLTLVRFATGHSKRNSVVWPRWDQIVFAAAAILAVWSILDSLSDWVGRALQNSYASWWLDYVVRHKLDNMVTRPTVIIFAAIGWVSLLLKVFWQLVAIGALVALVSWNYIDFKRLCVVFRKQPVSWLLMSLAVIVLSQALDWAFQHLYAWLPLNPFWPIHTTKWRPAVLPMIASYFANIPWTLANVIPILMMARAFAPFVAEREASLVFRH